MIGLKRAQHLWMDFRTILGVVGALLQFLHQAHSQCPEKCMCRGTTVDCQLSYIPSALPNTTTDITINGNNITAISNDSFVNLPELKRVDLSNNEISSLHPDAFSSLLKLREINLDGNRISVIENGTFANLRLDKLTLNNNPNLSDIEVNAFKGTELRTLELSGCNFQTLRREVFQDLKVSLMYITLSLNLQSLALPAGLFRGFTFEHVSFQYDDLDSVSFLSGTKAALVDLTGNRKLGDAAWNVTRVMGLVEELILNDVNLTIVDIPYDSTIEGLDLSNNNIEYLNGSDFTHAKSLFSLILTNNKLAQIPENLGYFVPRLIILILSHNDLGPIFDPEVLNGTSLHVLELQHCGIQTIPLSARIILRNIRTVKLIGNPLHCNCEMRWLNDWARSLKYGETDLRLDTCATPNSTAGDIFIQKRPTEFLCSTPLMVFTAKHKAKVGAPLEIHCKASGEPAPTIELYRLQGSDAAAGDGELLLTVSAVDDKTITETYLVYSLSRYKCGDAGLYTCKATNPAGGAAETVQVGLPPEGVCSHETVTPTPVAPPPDNDYLITSSPTTPSATTPRGSTPPSVGKSNNDDDDDENPSKNTAYILPLVVCLVLLLLVATVIGVVIWERKSRRKYDLYNQHRQPRIAYINNAMEVDEQSTRT